MVRSDRFLRLQKLFRSVMPIQASLIVATLANCGFYTIRGVNQVISLSAKTFYIYQKMDPLPDGRG